jgi:hypothetical protein
MVGFQARKGSSLSKARGLYRTKYPGLCPDDKCNVLESSVTGLFCGLVFEKWVSKAVHTTIQPGGRL